ncbi:MAG: M28 family peptidase, partial [Acidobacteriota bacterium]
MSGSLSHCVLIAAVAVGAMTPGVAREKLVAGPTSAAAPEPGGGPALPKGVEAAMNTISSGRIRVHLRFLASDLLEGRGTGERGAQIAAEYIAAQFQLSALWPGGAGNSYKQRVPLVGGETLPETTLSFEGGEGAVGPPLRMLDDYVVWTDTQQPTVDSTGEMIFVGYGVEAPEYGWDDYKGQDVTGKVLVMLVNDPPSADPSVFGGKALTYYGRWTYKYEEAARRGAIGALLIHTDESAGYGWEVVRNSWSGERSFNELDPKAPMPLQQAGWLTDRTARALFAAAGQDLDALRDAAARSDFVPVPLGLSAKAHIVTALRRFDSSNVIAFVPGKDESLKDEAVILTAHYDHLGIGTPDESGDGIYNGAYDNASGV